MKNTEYSSNDPVVDKLMKKLAKDKKLTKLLLDSLEKARKTAKKNLDDLLYRALDWPVKLATYQKYLEEFARWIPQQSSDPAWTAPGTDEQQEVYDRLCHFYYLIDQPVGPKDSVIVQNLPWFSKWLVDYANDWGSFLDSTDSFNDDILNSFLKNSPKYEVENSMVNGKPNSPSGWLTFNQFFARELNPGLRPIADPFDNTVVVSPADCTYRAQYRIGPDSTIDQITVKKTHQYASVKELLKGSDYEDAFANGHFAHYFLGPYSYHRFHLPVSGVVKECYPVMGKVFLDVNITDNQFDAPDNSEGAYEFYQARGIITIDTTDSPYGNVGIVAVIPIGMAQVSSVHMTATPGAEMLKGDEFGYFLFGGSDIIVLFQDGIDALIGGSTEYHRYGSVIAHCDDLDIF